jgi:hypothetical protein
MKEIIEDEETVGYREALFSILRANRVDVIKEIAADALDVDLSDYYEEDEDIDTMYDIDNFDDIEVDELIFD